MVSPSNNESRQPAHRRERWEADEEGLPTLQEPLLLVSEGYSEHTELRKLVLLTPAVLWGYPETARENGRNRKLLAGES